ncbi:unnamed protein product [Phaedon cochleariae]|uniref:AH domain-containing protein n=1 Tax=Phaedon cochleariae TaxID=80249 RepID=A0A9P0DU41_PHACE|nr:unnamed protein product [Phaedon cochleariae]
MQHQYWVTKKSVLRKLGGKEDDCIISSDAELDAKLELFKSINESCSKLQRVIDLYQERLCYLAQEENTLGRYLKDCGKNEKNASAGQIMSVAGKALAYTGHQRLTIRPSLVRLHHEVDTFRARAITDTRVTVVEMEKARTEYRAALSWMKSVSSQLDPDSGHGLEKFRKAQSYVKTSKVKFDRYTLACLQKVDLLAAARCNMFSHALVPYQKAIVNFSTKASDTLSTAAAKLESVQPLDNSAFLELVIPSEADKDKKTFFNADYTDETIASKNEDQEDKTKSCKEPEAEGISNLLEGNFAPPPLQQELLSPKSDETKPSAALLDLNWSMNSDFLGGDFMPSKLMQEGSFDFLSPPAVNMETPETDDKNIPKASTTENQVSWLSLFAELDPLANSSIDEKFAGDRA